MTHKSVVTDQLARFVVDHCNKLSIRAMSDQINRWHHETFYTREYKYW